ncbi:MAG: caspase family protein [Saprospiraceae bacterium]|nr:caspase family protein [Candidatus Vicinibacter affinis]
MKNQILIFAFVFLVEAIFAQQPVFNLNSEKGATPISVVSGQRSVVNSTYAVVVGISDYQDPGITDLRFADKDAEAFANYLRSNAGGKLDNDHLKVLLNEKATVAQFAMALDWLMEVVKENDQVILYFSGHGDVEKKTITQPGYLLCWDAPSRVYLAGGALALPMFQDIISTLSTQNKAKVVVITDACRSGKLAGSSVGGSQITGANLAKQYANEIKILSCQPNEYSIEGEQWGGGRGAFSYHLIDALYGLADNNNDLIVNLQEAGRYIEDHVSAEVAPISQLPMVLGNRAGALSKVDSKMLASIKSGKSTQMSSISSIDSRGMEDEVMATVDSSVRLTYKLFKQALKDKMFLEPVNACAEKYYSQLINEPKLEQLHSTMRRNYAAALQDDAQQAVNKYLKTDKFEFSLSPKKRIENYNNFPQHLERAAQLLGKQHYLYRNLQARRFYFEGFPLAFTGGYNRSSAEQALSYFKQALEWQPDMPTALLGMSWIFGSQLHQLDSAELYAHKATAAAPSWVLPYVYMAENFLLLKKYEKAKQFLEIVDQIDSSSLHVWGAWATYYFNKKEFSEAERRLNKIVTIMDGSFCLPCSQTLLTEIYFLSGRMTEAEVLLKKLIEHDSTHYSYHLMLGRVFAATSRYSEAEQEFKKVAILASEYTNYDDLYYYNMVIVYNAQNQMDKAFQSLEKSLMAGNDDFYYMQEDSDLAPLRKQTERWNALMKKYFPEKFK